MTTPEERDDRNVAMLRAWDAGHSVTEIAKRFELSLSWTGIVLRELGAEMPPIRKGVKRTDVDPLVDDLVDEYVVGEMTIRAIAEKHSLTYSTVYRRLIDAGVELRPRGGAH